MTLSVALGNATSSLRAIQLQLALAASNIANAKDENYTAKKATLSTNVSNGIGTGVDVTAIIGKVDSNLIRDIIDAKSANGSAQTFYKYMKSLSDKLGTVGKSGSGNSLVSSLSTVLSNLQKLASTPESVTLKGQLLSSLSDMAANLRDVSSTVQTLRSNADSDIGKSVESANATLHKIDSLNKAIIRTKGSGQSTAELEDQRNAALKELSEHLGVNSRISSNGSMQIYTKSGEVLLGDNVHELSFTTTSNITSSAKYPGGLSGISLNGQDITNSLSSGKLSALIKHRDSVLPDMQSQLDKTANSLKDILNTISNTGSSAPPPQTLTGTTSHTSSSSFSGSGTVQIALTDSEGKVTKIQNFTLSNYSNVGDLVNAIDATSGISAHLDSDGHLVIKADTSTNGVVVSGGTVGSNNLSGYFGLNDLLTGTGAEGIRFNSSLKDEAANLPTGSISTLTVGNTAVAKGSSSLIKSVISKIQSSKSSDSLTDLIGSVSTKTQTAKTHAQTAETSLKAQQTRFSSQYGVNVDEETANITQLQNAYSASAQIIKAVQSMFDDLLSAVR